MWNLIEEQKDVIKREIISISTKRYYLNSVDFELEDMNINIVEGLAMRTKKSYNERSSSALSSNMLSTEHIE